MGSSLSDDLAVAAAGAWTQPAVAAALGVDSERLARMSLATAAADQQLRCVVTSYRAGDRQVWAAVLLELLAPAMIPALLHYEPVDPTIGLDDIAQQFVLEVLDSADHIRLSDDTRYIARRLLLRARKRVGRWLAREQAKQDRQDCPDDPGGRS